jgi:hypothetical protein
VVFRVKRVSQHVTVNQTKNKTPRARTDDSDGSRFCKNAARPNSQWIVILRLIEFAATIADVGFLGLPILSDARLVRRYLQKSAQTGVLHF